MNCPNCLREHGVAHACFLGLLLGVAHDRRGGVSEAEVARVFSAADVSYLWDTFGGPAVDYVEDLLDRKEASRA